MMYLYGLLDPEAVSGRLDLDTLDGVTGPVSLSPSKHGHVIHGAAPNETLLPKRRFLMAHTKVLEAMNEVGTVLPMRFGMTAPDAATLEAMLATEASSIATSFQRLKGAAEFGVRISFDRTAALDAVLANDHALRAERDRLARRRPAPHFEAAEFGRRLAEALDARRGAAQKVALAALRPHVRDYVLRSPENDAQILAIDVLIARGAEESLSQRLQTLADESVFAPGTAPKIRLIGPVPSYSFVNLTVSPGTDEAA